MTTGKPKTGVGLAKANDGNKGNPNPPPAAKSGAKAGPNLTLDFASEYKVSQESGVSQPTVNHSIAQSRVSNCY